MHAAARFKDRRSSCTLQPGSRTGAVHARCSHVQGPAQFMHAAATFKVRRSSCTLQPGSRSDAVHARCSQVQGPAQTSSSSKNAGPFCELKKLKLFDLTGKYLQCFSHEDECFAAGNQSICAACMNCCQISFHPHAVLQLLRT